MLAILCLTIGNIDLIFIIISCFDRCLVWRAKHCAAAAQNEQQRAVMLLCHEFSGDFARSRSETMPLDQPIQCATAAALIVGFGACNISNAGLRGCDSSRFASAAASSLLASTVRRQLVGKPTVKVRCGMLTDHINRPLTT